MEGSKSEAVFESLGLNPRLFINETLNAVDDLLSDAFDFYLQETSTLLLNTQSTDRSRDLENGVKYIRSRVQSLVDKRLGMWEKYCLHHCFALPQGFSLPSNEVPPDTSVIQDALNDQDLDSQLNSLRDRLRVAGAESANLNCELLELEKKSASSECAGRHVNEALALLESNNAHEMFQDMTKAASQLYSKLEKINSVKVKNGQQTWEGLTGEQYTDFSQMPLPKGLSHVKLDDLQEGLAGLRNV